MNQRMKSSPCNRQYQRGVNLIEIMVAMAIGLFLVLGATTLYVNTKKTSDVDDAIARLQETARYAMSMIETDVRMANYMGLVKDASTILPKASDLVTGAIDLDALSAGTGADACGSTFLDQEGYATGTNNSYTFNCAANTTAVTSADTLTIRRAATATVAQSNTQIQVCSTRAQGFMAFGVNPDCVAMSGAEYHDYLVHGYYVDQQSSQNATYPSLRRKTLIDGPAFNDVEIIPGVEDMQIEFGWDRDEDDQPNSVRYLQPGDPLFVDGAGAVTGRVVAVRVWLLIRAEQADPTFTDTRVYQYGDRSTANGTVSTLNAIAAQTAAYAPNDNFRRLLVSGTFFIRNVRGNY